MKIDDKIAKIANLIEHILKQDGKFIELESEKICLDLLTIQRYLSHESG